MQSTSKKSPDKIITGRKIKQEQRSTRKMERKIKLHISYTYKTKRKHSNNNNGKIK